jgi:hypothetical protein
MVQEAETHNEVKKDDECQIFPANEVKKSYHPPTLFTLKPLSLRKAMIWSLKLP